MVAVGLSNLRREPEQTAELLSQGLFGERCEVEAISADGRWLRIAGEDGYMGWTRTWSLATGTKEAARAWRERATLVVPQKLLWRTEGGGPLPFGARLAPGPERAGVFSGPDGPVHLSPADSRRLIAHGTRTRARGGRAVVRSAVLFLGAPYLWGGRSVIGVDCSGLAQLCHAASGVTLPRDAREQCRWLGGARKLRAFRPGVRGGEPRPGDLLFFGPEGPDGDVTHVAISTGGAELLHAFGWVRPGSLDPTSDVYEPDLPSILLGWARSPAAQIGRSRDASAPITPSARTP